MPRANDRPIDLQRAIDDRSAVLGFVGLGYVGLPVSLSLAAAGFRVRGCDSNLDRIKALRARQLPFAHREPGLLELLASIGPGAFDVSAEQSILADADVVFVAIDTPLGDDGHFDADRFTAGIRTGSASLRPGTALIVESTIPPGTIDRIVIPELEARSLVVGRDVLVLHCPERLRPGRLLHNLRSMGRLIGGDSDAAVALGIALYRTIVPAPLQGVHYRTAEVCKTAENTVRDVQIALANQLAVVCDSADVDFRQVRAAVNTLWRDEPIVLEAGPGVGGHCLPKDPWLMVEGVPDARGSALVRGARAMNDFMPQHVADLATAMLEGSSRPLSEATVVVLGLAYNDDSDDDRNSPGRTVAAALRSAGAEVREHDPLIPRYGGSLDEAFRGADLAVLIDAHSDYRSLDYSRLAASMRTRLFLDTRRAFDAQVMTSHGLTYRALGVGERRAD
jgi:UDP-N-acetyl-D-mannosaminuronic acid dehydrogenase